MRWREFETELSDMEDHKKAVHEDIAPKSDEENTPRKVHGYTG
jgi:hypothetical protein